jgi:hypothetical protein
MPYLAGLLVVQDRTSRNGSVNTTQCTSLRWDVPPALEAGFGVSGPGGGRSQQGSDTTITTIHRYARMQPVRRLPCSCCVCA